MTDRPLYTTMNLTKQHAEWITATCGRFSSLPDEDLLLIRAVHFHDWLGHDEDRWNARHDDMHTTALAAGLTIRGGGYTYADGGAPVALPPEPFLGLDPAVAIAAYTLTESVLWRSPREKERYYRPSLTERQVTVTALSAILAVSLDAYSWTWWTCNLLEGDTPATVTARALYEMIADGNLDTSIEWTVSDLQAAHDLWSRSGMRAAVDPDHLMDAALTAGLKLRIAYRDFSFIQ
jgi:hypothetical protein